MSGAGGPTSQLERGNQLAKLGRHREAIPYLTAAADGYLAAGDVVNAARAYGNVGLSHRSDGNPTKALDYSRRAVALFERTSDRRGLSAELLLQANTLAKYGDPKGAMDAHMKSAGIADEIGDELLLGMNLFRLSLHWIAAGMPGEGRGTLRYASLLYVRTGQGDYEADCRKVIADLRQAGSVETDPVHTLLDELFRTRQTDEAIAELMTRHPAMSDPQMLKMLDGFTLEAIQLRCVVKAIADTTAIVRGLQGKRSRGNVEYNSTAAAVKIVNFEKDVPETLIEAMASSESPSAGLSVRASAVVRMLSVASGVKIQFGGFTPAGNVHGIFLQGKVFVNYLATHRLAVGLARMRGIPYAQAFAESIVAVLICESAHALEPGYQRFGPQGTRGSHLSQTRMRATLRDAQYKLLVDEFAKFMADQSRYSQMEQMYRQALSGWMEGARRAREAANMERG